jgi:O-antigen/teichoic acid export membrane protein
MSNSTVDIFGRTVKKDITELAMAVFRWNLYLTISVVLMQLFFGIILARLLPPEAFGLFFYAMVLVGFISVYAQAGIPEAIIQRQKITKEHIAAGFTLTLLIGLSATIGLWMLAPILTKGTETSVLRTVSFLFFLSAFGALSGALLEKELNFKRLFWAEVISYGIGQGVTSIGLAMVGFGVWSLVYGVLIYTFIKSAVRMLMVRHSIEFSLESGAVKELMHFGFGRSLTRFGNYSAQNGHYFVIGHLLPPEALGLYSRAYQIARIPTSHITSLICSVLFPAYAAVQDDNRKLRKGFYLSVSVVSFVTFPLMVWLFITARKLIPTVYGPAWTNSIHSLEILTICGALGSIYTLCDVLVTAKGLVYAQSGRHLVYAIMVIIGAILGTQYGIEGVAFAVSIAVFIMYILMAQFSINIVGGTWREFFQAQVPGVVVGISIAFASSAVLLLGEKYVFSDLIVLLALTLSFAAIYPIALVLFPMSCLGEIPECLVVRCPSFLPPRFLKILSRRLNKKAGIDLREDTRGVTSNVRLSSNFKNTKWLELASRNIFLRLARRAYGEARMLNHVLQDSLVIYFLRRLRGVSYTPLKQPPLSWNVEIGQIRNAEDLGEFLIQNHIVFNEGGHTIYIRPQLGLEKIFGKMVAFYPSDAGFKVLKQFRSPQRVRYVGNLSYGIDGHPYSLNILTGSARDRAEAANVMHMFEIGPALYDVAEIIAKDTVMTCFVVQHIDGVNSTHEQHTEFLKRLSNLINKDIFALVPAEGLNYPDFHSPDCNGHLIKSFETGKLTYVDFEQLIVRNKERLINKISHEAYKFLDCDESKLVRAERYASQSISSISSIGMRDADKRWSIVKNLLNDSGINVASRIVLDIGCKVGMMLSCALTDGALWGIGWDAPDAVEAAKRLNAVLGNTRLNLYAAKLSEEYPIVNDIPVRLRTLLGESVIFYLAVWRDIGFMSELANIPWKALVFEGHEGDTWEDLNDQLLQMQSEWHCTLAVKLAITDGERGTRPIGVLARAN